MHPSHTYIFAVILSPVGSYYAAGLDPVKIMVEREYVRCVKGGTGLAKAGGNYAASLIGQKKAEDMGFADKDVVWVKVNTEGRSLIFGDVVCRVSEKFARAMHIDTDESNAAGCSGQVTGEIVRL